MENEDVAEDQPGSQRARPRHPLEGEGEGGRGDDNRGRKEGRKEGWMDGRKGEGRVVGVNETEEKVWTPPLPSVAAMKGSSSAVIGRPLEAR